jgi:diacylglycerol kinase family enzyme
MDRHAALIVNPVATGVTPERVEAVRRVLAEAGPVETLETRTRGHAAEVAADACQRYDEIFVYGGDGVFNEAVNGMLPSVPIGFIPGGATSVLPRALGLPRDPLACARRLARSRDTRRISLGRVNGRRFTFCAGLGLDAEIVRLVDQRGRKNGKRPSDVAYVADMARIVGRRKGKIAPTISVEGHGRCALLVAANCDPYTFAGPVPVHAAPLAQFELGLDLVGPRQLTLTGFAHLVWSLVVRPGLQTSRDGYLYAHDIDGAKVACDAPTPLQVDGEDLGDVTEVLLESERGALDVRV